MLVLALAATLLAAMGSSSQAGAAPVPAPQDLSARTAPSCAQQVASARRGVTQAVSAERRAGKLVRTRERRVVKARHTFNKADSVPERRKARVRLGRAKTKARQARVQRSTAMRKSVRARSRLASALECVDSANLRVVVTTPADVAANVEISGREDRLVSTSDTDTLSTTTLQLPVGTYTITALASLSHGRLYLGSVSAAKVTLSPEGMTTVTVTYAEAPAAHDLQVDGITGEAVSLTWTAPNDESPVALRRTSGDAPARSISDGSSVATSGAGATDSEVSGGETYSYALFTRVGDRWMGPVSVTLRTPQVSSEGSEVFQAAPGSVVFESRDQVPAVATSSGATITWPASRPLPIVGAGTVLPASAGLPGGLLGRVTKVGMDGRTVTVVPVALGDVFDLYSIDVPALDLVELSLPRSTGQADPAKASALSFSCEKDSGVTIDVDVAPVFGAPTGYFRQGVNRYNVLGVGVPSGAWWDAKVVFPVEVPVSVTTSGRASCSAKFKRAWSKNVWVVPVSLVLEGTVEVYFEAAIKVENLGFDLEAGFESSTDFDISQQTFSGDARAIYDLSPRTPEGSASATIGAKVSGEFLLGPGVADKYATSGAVAGIQGELVLLDAAAGPTAATSDEPFCFTVSAGGSADLRLAARAWFTPSNDWIRQYVGEFNFEATHPLLGTTWDYLDPPVTIPETCGAATQLRAASVTAGYGHACAIDADRRGLCWGDNGSGQLGVGVVDTDRHSRPVMIAGQHRWASLTAGHHTTCGITQTGSALCWGDNDYGTVGDGTRSTRSTPTPVFAERVWSALTIGNGHACGLDEGGRAWCWGRNQYGQLGTGSTEDRTTPQEVAGDHRWIAIDAGGFTTCAIRDDQTAWCWGANIVGELGDGTTQSRSTPTPVASSRRWTSLATGHNHTCAVDAERTGLCWGSNDAGRLGTGSSDAQSPPSAIAGSHTWTTIASGYGHTCGIVDAGSAWCWGEYSGLGDGPGNSQRSTPTPVDSSLTWQSITAGAGFACAIDTSGRVWCWGANSLGGLGDGSTIERDSPVAVLDVQQ